MTASGAAHRLDNSRFPPQLPRVENAKLDRLRSLLREYGSCVVAYSGGVDSVFLARVARDVLGDRMLAVIADSPSLPRRELAEALELGARHGFPVEVIRTREFDNPQYLANPSNRCYFCKHELFTELGPLARSRGFAVVAYGENASDSADFRPGGIAAKEFHVRAPLREAGLTKPEIRELSAALGLPTADKPQLACLSSRIPHGEPVTVEKLRLIEAAEQLLRELGFRELRVRHHQLPQGALARIEVTPAEMDRFGTDGVAAAISQPLRQLGYAWVTLDLAGYRPAGTSIDFAPPRP